MLPSPLAGGAPVTPLVAPANEGEVQGCLDNARQAELTMMDRAGSTWRMDGYTRYPGEGRSSITTFAPSVDPDLPYLAHHYELAAAHRTWRIYSGVPPAVYAGTVWQRLLPSGGSGAIVPASQLFADLRRGTLPAFSLVRPGVGYSEEPPEDVGDGDAWLGQLVGALGRSPDWRSTAVFVTYDEGGGFYDNGPPPVVPGTLGDGTRTPLVIVSPYARRGTYSGTTTNLSVLSFTQHLFGLPPLDARNAAQDDLAGAFDLAARPLPPPRRRPPTGRHPGRRGRPRRRRSPRPRRRHARLLPPHRPRPGRQHRLVHPRRRVGPHTP